MSQHNSTLIALGELMKLEAQRVQELEDQAQAQRQAEDQARERAKQRARAQAARARAEALERQRVEQAAREHQQREERIRVAEAEARSRDQAQARLREEQMRLDAQVEIARRKKRPTWLYATAALLGLALVGGGVYSQMTQQAEEAETQRIAAALAERDRELEQLELKAQALEDEMAANVARQIDLRGALDEAQNEQERARIQAALDEQSKQQRSLDRRLGSAKQRRGGGKHGGKGDNGHALVLDKSDEPL